MDNGMHFSEKYETMRALREEGYVQAASDHETQAAKTERELQLIMRIAYDLSGTLTPEGRRAIGQHYEAYSNSTEFLEVRDLVRKLLQ